MKNETLNKDVKPQYQIYKRIYIGKHRQSVWLDCCYTTYKKYGKECRRITNNSSPDNNTNSKVQVIRCERCNEKLNPKTAVWLELSQTDGKYYKQIPVDHVSQGSFSFGIACSKTQLREDHIEKQD